MKKMFAGIVIGILLTVTTNAAVQEYTLKQSECKLVVDGVEVKDEKLPVLLMEPGYNYAPVASLRDVCGKIGVGFEFDVPTKEVRLTTKQEIKTVSTKNITPTAAPVEYFEPYTMEYDGKKLVFLGDVNTMLKPLGYEIAASYKSDNMLWLRCNGAPVIKDIKYSMNKHPDHTQGVAYLEYDFYIANIEPLIKK
jgi:hypothetical protein